MTLKESILIEYQIKNPLLMEVNFLKIYDKLSPNDRKRVNASVTNVITSKFEPKFGKYLNDKLYNMSRKVELLQVLKDIEDGDNGVKLRLFTIIGNIAMDYYEGIIKTKLFKSPVSGDRTIDRIYQRMISEMFDNPKIHKFFIDNIEKVLDKKMKAVFSDTRYDDLVNEGVRDKVSRFVDTKFGGREAKLRWAVLDRILKFTPNINYELKSIIKTKVFSSSYQLLNKLSAKPTPQNIANALTEPILRYVINVAINKFKGSGDDFINNFLGIMGKVSIDNKFEKQFEIQLARYFSTIPQS